MSDTKRHLNSSDSECSQASDETPIVCPRCQCQLVGVAKPCPDPRAHAPREEVPVAAIRVYGGQLRTSYRIDPEGLVWIPFQRWDGAVREYGCFWPFRDPDTGEQLPWMIAQAFLQRDDLEFVTGLSPSAFNGASAAAFPGRLPGRHRVVVETTQFVREYIFGSVVRERRWHRTTRAAKRARHTPTCRPGCRRRHR